MDCTRLRAHRHALRRGRISIPEHAYFVTVCCQKRQRLFMDIDAARAVSITLDTVLRDRSSSMLAWVVMPDHVHYLLRLGGEERLPDVVRRINSRTAKAANTALSRTGPVWQGAFHDRAIRDENGLIDAARYLLANPLRAGLARHLGDYPYWNVDLTGAVEALT